MRLIFIFLIVLFHAQSSTAQAGTTKSILEIATQADLQCMDFKVLGPCIKKGRNPPVGVRVRYWQPELLMETVQMPGAYVIQEYGTVLQSLARKIASMELQNEKVTSGGNFHALSSRNTSFNEVHLYDFPLNAVIDVVLCSEVPNGTLGVRYLTEADSLAWRKADLERHLPQSMAAPVIGPQCPVLSLGAGGQCMKSWGPLYPRQGFTITSTQAVASAVSAIRSVSITGNPLPNHIVESKLDFQPNLPIDKLQLVYPKRTSCFPIGQDPRQWSIQSKDGQYVWIYWHRRQCCL
jgi:hypothetical protein